MFLVVAVLTGCGADAGSSPPSTMVEPQSGTIEVQALDNRFAVRDVTITAGSTVRWSNDGTNRHDVVPAEGTAFGVKPDDFPPDATYSFTFGQPGTYPYYCTLHGTATRGMIGSVTVVEP
jgi:plastocyanin